jgi:hypothetical protein
MASAGTVTVDFAADTAGFTADLKKVQQSLKSMETGFSSVGSIARTALGFFSVTAVTSFARAAFEAADATATAAERAGIAVESFSRLQFAAGQADVEMGALTTGIQKFQVAISEASSGGKAAQETLARFGLEAEKLRSLTIEQQLGEVADAFAKITDPATRTRLAVDLFGRSAGPQLVPLLAQGREGIAQLTTEADKLGVTLTENTAAAVDQTDKAIKRLVATLKGAATSALASLSVAILGDPDEIRRIDDQLESLRVERIKLLSGDVEGLTVNSKAWRAELDAIQGRMDALVSRQRELVAASRTPVLAGSSPFGEGVEGRGSPVSEIDIAAIQAMKIGVDELDQAYRRLAISAEEIQRQRRESLVVDSEDVAKQMTDASAAELERYANLSEFYRQQEVEREKAAAQSMADARIGALNAVQMALQSFAGRSEKAAKALVLVEKARALYQAFVNTKAAITLQLSSGDPYTAVARAAAVGAFGALQIAAIAASGYGQIKSVGSGGAPLGHPANPVTTQSSATEEQIGATSQKVVQVIVANNVGFDQSVMNKIIAGIRSAADDGDVIIFGPNSRQAKELVSVRNG